MKKLFPSLLILILVASLILLFKNGLTEDKQPGGTCSQVVCPASGASGVTIDIYDGSGTLVASCNTGSAICCTITGLITGNTYTAVYHGSTCAKERVKFIACTGGNLQVPGCP
jgi:hypothetical protein